jgi:hypothetical protein
MDWLFLVAVVVVVLLVPFMYSSHGAVQYHSRFVFYIFSVSLTALACLPLYCLNPLSVKNSL